MAAMSAQVENVLRWLAPFEYSICRDIGVEMGGSMKKIMIILVALAAISCGIALWADTKIVRVPRPVQNESQSEEVIDLEMQDVFTEKSFAQLMNDQHEHDLPYIVARVVSKNYAGDRIRYCNAHDLNKIFGGYPLRGSASSYSFKTPQSGFPVQHVDYFIINNPDDAAFLYLCSYYELMVDPAQKDKFREIFHANQVEDPQLHVKAQRRLAVDEQFDPLLSAKAKMRLGEIYFAGRYGMQKDYDQASQYLEDVLENPHSDSAVIMRAHGILGQIYYSGEYGADKNYKKVCRSLEQILSEQKDPQALATMQLQLGQLYYAGGYGLGVDYARAHSYFEQVANQDANPAAAVRAQYRLGQIYYRGQGVEKNYEKARDYFDHIAQQDVVASLAPDAMIILGEIAYMGGNGVTQDYPLAYSYYQKAAQQKENLAVAARGTYWLGEMHYFGKASNGIENYDEALRLWEKVAKQDDNLEVAARAKYWLGTLYYEGKGTGKNTRVAIRYLKEAAKQERDPWACVEARSWLAWLYYEGDGVRKDYKEALSHWDYVAHQPYNLDVCVDAMLSIGEIYTTGGYGVAKDQDRARSYFERVLEQEGADSENAVKAREWLSQIKNSCSAQ